MKRIALNLAASSMVLGATTLSFMVSGVGVAPAAAFQPSRADGEAAQFHARAGRAIAEGRLAEAVGLLEQAVALSPRDAGYRLLLADAYMKSGRFQSAQTTYRDVVELDPSQTRAGIALAIMQVANGQPQAAMAQLERIEGSAPAVDVGLAYALAGAPQRAIEVLEPAARAMGATPRIRQNLALAYAFGGDWRRARTIAAQDVSPSDLADRMTQWASFAHRAGTPDPVAALLGVSPVQDAGQPVQVALLGAQPETIAEPQAVALASADSDWGREPAAPAEAEPAPVFAEAAPASVPVISEPPAPVVYAAATVPMPAESHAADAAAVQEPEAVPAPAPVALAEAAPDAGIVAVPAPEPTAPAATAYAELEAPEWGLDEQGNVQLPDEEPAEEREPVRVRYAAAAENLLRPDPVVMRVTSRAGREIAPLAARAFAAAALPGKRSAEGRFVVQIGAFSSAANAERAWDHYSGRFGLSAERPVTMTIDHQGRLLHRVAMSGFTKRGDASQVCRIIKARGGECFVRSNAGDAAIDWAARYSRNG